MIRLYIFVAFAGLSLFSGKTFAQTESFDGQKIVEYMSESQSGFGGEQLELMATFTSLGLQQATKIFDDVEDDWVSLGPGSNEAVLLELFGEPERKHQSFDDGVQVYDYWYAGSIVAQAMLNAEGMIVDKLITKPAQ